MTSFAIIVMVNSRHGYLQKRQKGIKNPISQRMGFLLLTSSLFEAEMLKARPRIFKGLLKSWIKVIVEEDMRKIVKLILSIIICESAGVLGSLFTAPAIENWYAFLAKPSFSPPNWLFGPAWVLLYALIGIAIALVWPKLWKLFSIHLIVNALWSISFFGLKNPLLGLINIIILWVLILVLLLKFYRLNKTSFWLFVPYFLWVSFATALNFSIWQLNS